MRHSVLISGAGIAGPVLASLLARRGVAVTVVETADGVRPGGQAVDLRGAGRTVLDRMGLLEAARAMALDQQGIADVDADGRHLTEMRVTDFGGEGIISEIEILRGDLAELLVADSVGRGVEYLFGTRITALSDLGDRVRVDLSDGSVREVGLVVGADGPHSGTRRLVFGPEEEFVDPLGGYMAWFTCPEGESLDGWYAMYNHPGGLAASLRPGRLPGTAKASLAFTSPPLDYDRHDIAQQRALLATRFRNAGWRTAELVDAARTAEDFYLDALVQVHLPRWSRGRITLIGDAAYCPSPLTGLGTSLALVGAHVLAGELTSRDDHAAALLRYEELVRPYVRTAQTLPPGGIRGYAPSSRFAIWLRVATTRLMVSRLFSGIAKKLFFSKAEAIALPDYEPDGAAQLDGRDAPVDAERMNASERSGRQS